VLPPPQPTCSHLRGLPLNVGESKYLVLMYASFNFDYFIGLLVKFFIAASSLSFAVQIRVGNIIGKQGSYALGLLNFTVVSIQHVCFLTDSFCILIVLVVLASRAHLRGTYYYYSINLLPNRIHSILLSHTFFRDANLIRFLKSITLMKEEEKPQSRFVLRFPFFCHTDPP